MSRHRIFRTLAFFVAFIPSVLLAADAQDEMPSPPPKPLSTTPAPATSYYAFGAVPAVNYSSDAGFGFGAVGSIYKKLPSIHPYKFAIDVQIFLTTLGQHSHYVRTDFLDVGNLPLRLRSKAGFFATINQNYCGKGMLADCDPQIAETAINEISPAPTGEERELLLSRYFLFRYFEIYGTIEGRWRLRDMPNKIEIIAGWRGSYYWPGSFGAYGNYENSLFAKDFSRDEDVRGFASVIEAGIMLDNRDNEPSPTRGYWFEATVRESSPYWGSRWSYLGFNLSLRGYFPFDTEGRWVFAAQAIFDGLIGDAPLHEIVRIGGSLRETAFGGAEMGRGIREQGFPGRVKLLKQLEMRYRFVGFDILSQHFDVSAAAFADLGVTSWDWDQFQREPFKPLIGFGGGARIAWNDAFVIRFDIGTSPIESYAPRFYVKVGNVF